MAVTFAVWGAKAKHADFFFLLHDFRDRWFVLIVDRSNLNIQFFPFFIKSRTFTFLLTESTLWLLFGIFRSPESLRLHFGDIIKWNKGHLNTSTVTPWQAIWYPRGLLSDQWVGYARQRDDSHPGRVRPGGSRFHYRTQNGAKFKTYELFTSGIFRLIFLDCGWPWVTETVESETTDKGRLQYFYFEKLICNLLAFVTLLYGVVIKSPSFEVGHFSLSSGLNRISLHLSNLSVLICKMRIIIAATTWSCCEMYMRQCM